MVTVKRLRGLMAENKVTQSELSKLLNISKNTFSRKMNKKSEFTLSEAEKISNYFGEPIDKIFIVDLLEEKKAS